MIHVSPMTVESINNAVNTTMDNRIAKAISTEVVEVREAIRIGMRIETDALRKQGIEYKCNEIARAIGSKTARKELKKYLIHLDKMRLATLARAEEARRVNAGQARRRRDKEEEKRAMRQPLTTTDRLILLRDKRAGRGLR